MLIPSHSVQIAAAYPVQIINSPDLREKYPFYSLSALERAWLAPGSQRGP
jgi:hypothetical protein